MKDLLPCRIWILVSAWATLAGWSLGLSGNISRAGYAGTLLPLVLLLAFLWHKNCPDVAVGYAKKCNTPFRLIRYFKRSWRGISHVSFWLPVLFIFVALLTFAGGALSAPNNYDALSYRLPRILRWIEDGRWSWIDTSNPRQNYSAPGFEWQMLPLAIFGKTDRLFFLINWISFLLLPSLVFRTFRLTGLPKQTCWWWMWILLRLRASSRQCRQRWLRGCLRVGISMLCFFSKQGPKISRLWLEHSIRCPADWHEGKQSALNSALVRRHDSQSQVVASPVFQVDPLGLGRPRCLLHPHSDN